MGLPNKNELQGGATRVGGEIKEKIGRVFDDEELENEGRAEQVQGAAQADFGKLQRDAKNAFNETVADLGDAAKESQR